MEELNGKVGIDSGAGRLRGIGRAPAIALAHLGVDVVVTGTVTNPIVGMPFRPKEVRSDSRRIPLSLRAVPRAPAVPLFPLQVPCCQLPETGSRAEPDTSRTADERRGVQLR